MVWDGALFFGTLNWCLTSSPIEPVALATQPQQEVDEKVSKLVEENGIDRSYQRNTGTAPQSSRQNYIPKPQRLTDCYF